MPIYLQFSCVQVRTRFSSSAQARSQSTVAYATRPPHRVKQKQKQNLFFANPGSVQPRRATILQDVFEDDDIILVEYWDGGDDESAEQVERCPPPADCVKDVLNFEVKLCLWLC